MSQKSLKDITLAPEVREVEFPYLDTGDTVLVKLQSPKHASMSELLTLFHGATREGAGNGEGYEAVVRLVGACMVVDDTQPECSLDEVGALVSMSGGANPEQSELVMTAVELVTGRVGGGAVPLGKRGGAAKSKSAPSSIKPSPSQSGTGSP